MEKPCILRLTGNDRSSPGGCQVFLKINVSADVQNAIEAPRLPLTFPLRPRRLTPPGRLNLENRSRRGKRRCARRAWNKGRVVARIEWRGGAACGAIRVQPERGYCTRPPIRGGRGYSLGGEAHARHGARWRHTRLRSSLSPPLAGLCGSWRRCLSNGGRPQRTGSLRVRSASVVPFPLAPAPTSSRARSGRLRGGEWRQP